MLLMMSSGTPITLVGEYVARIFHELAFRDHEDGCATGQPQGVGPEAYLNSTSQGPTPEDARKDTHIRGRSRPFMKYAGWETMAIVLSMWTVWATAVTPPDMTDLSVRRTLRWMSKIYGRRGCLA